MILAHLSDLHLGFRAHGRIERGRNVREADVATAFQRAVQELLRIRPDVVVIAGDVLDHPEPPPSALVTLGRGLETLRDALPDAPVLLIAGARDVPVSGSEPGVLAAFDTLPGVEAVTSTARSVLLRERGLRVLLVPHPVLARPPLPELRPDPKVRWNVLVTHVTVSDREGVSLDPAPWDYVALGGRHRPSIVAPNVRYAGSLERVGLHPWREAAEEKGFVVWDLESGEGRFHTLPGRPVVSLAPLRFPAGDPARAERRMREVLSEVPGGLDGKLVRLPLPPLPPATLAEVDLRVLAPFRRRALHLQVETAPEMDVAGAEIGEGGRGVGPVAPDPRAAAPDPGPAAPRPEPGTGITALLVLRSRDRAVLREAREAETEEGIDDPADLLDRLLTREPVELAEAAGRRSPAADVDGGAGDEVEGRGASPDVARLEEQLAGLRADSAELEGEVEVSTMGWLRERQDAETRLQAYRDRARELKARLRQLDAAGPEAPCPTCGRLLDEQHDDVIEELREEWEAVVRDGQWWKRRREQLELKPERLQEMELRQMRLHASLEEAMERLERARMHSGSAAAQTHSRGAASHRRPGAASSGSPPGPLLQLAGARLSRITGGRLLGFLPRTSGESLRVAGPETRGEPGEEEDRAAARASLRLAAAELSESQRRLVLPLEDVRGMGGDDRLRLLELLGELLPRIPRVALETDGFEVERMPDLVERVVEVRERSDRGERPTLHAWRPGPAALRIEGATA